MKLPFTGLSNIQKFFISLTIIFLIALFDYRAFLNRSKQVELYEDLNYRLSSVRVSIAKLEYLLDMFVVARRFENTTVDLIKNDVAKLDENMNEVLGNAEYSELLQNNTLLSEGFASISDDWLTIKNEVKRLEPTMSQDEIMLLHNAVDVNTVLVTEKADRLISAIDESRKTVFAQAKSLALQSIIGFIFLILFASLILYKKVLTPINKAVDIARRLLAGNSGARFKEDSGSAMGKLAFELNKLLDSANDARIIEESKNLILEQQLKRKDLQIESLTGLLTYAGRSLSQTDIFHTAVREAIAASGADTAAIYIAEGMSLKLKASAGSDDIFIKEASVLSSEDFNFFESPKAFWLRGPGGFTSNALAEKLKAGGFEFLAVSPISYNRESMGFIVAVFRENADVNSDGIARFLRAIASGIGVSAGHSGLFQSELNSKKFFERLINQVPFGLAVFDKEGGCLMLNNVLKRYLGFDQRTSFAGAYNIFKDEVFSSQGMLETIRKTYEGYSTEFIINYNPSQIQKYALSGTNRTLRIKSFPLYDAGGEISNIALIYEELTEAESTLTGGEGL
ncbi:MAG: methyl-accepting chemotaxis protein [Deltaproteobacteria bacterium]|nr:methyl-accepting chemotaxis protein [Deltaproteobacteria bacterium]